MDLSAFESIILCEWAFEIFESKSGLDSIRNISALYSHKTDSLPYKSI